MKVTTFRETYGRTWPQWPRGPLSWVAATPNPAANLSSSRSLLTKVALRREAMTDFVSNRWTGVDGLAATISVSWLVFILYGLPWTGLVWVGLAFSTALLAGPRSTHPTARV